MLDKWKNMVYNIITKSIEQVFGRTPKEKQNGRNCKNHDIRHEQQP